MANTVKTNDITKKPAKTANAAKGKIKQSSDQAPVVTLDLSEPAIPFIDGEHINNDGSPSRELSVLAQADREIAKLDTNKVKIAEWKEQFKGLTVASLDDKAGISALKAAKATIRTARTTLEKRRSDIKADYLLIGRKIDAAAKDYETSLQEIETPLDDELKKVKEWEQAEATRKENEARAEINRRIELLKENGMTFDGQYYVVGDSMAMDIVTITAMSLKDFEALSLKVQTAASELKKAQAEQARKEQERLENEERERMETLRQKEENEREQQRIANEREEMRREKMEMRDGQLLAIGFEFLPGYLVYKFSNSFLKCEFTKAQVEAFSNDEFKSIIAENKDQILKAKDAQVKKDAADAAERERLEKERIEQAEATRKENERIQQEKTNRYNERTTLLISSGLALVGSIFLRKNEFNDSATISVDRVRDEDATTWDASFKQLLKHVQIVDENTTHKRAKIEEKRQAQLPEIEKVKTYFSNIFAVAKPNVQLAETKDVLVEFSTSLNTIISKATEFLEKIEAGK